MSDTGTAGTQAATATAATATTPAWYAGADAEIIGHIQNRGWHEKTPAEAAVEAAKAHREAEKFLGVPKEQLLRVPKDAADEAGWNDVYSRLGQPKDAKEYDFTGLKQGEADLELDTADADWLRGVANKLHLSKDAARQLALEIDKHGSEGVTTQATEHQAALVVEKAELAKNWGPNMDLNLLAARQGAVKLGFDADTVGKLEGVVGYGKIMEALRRVGAAGTEAGFVANSGAGQGGAGVTTREQAVARRSELMNDADWGKRYMGGDTAAVREMTSLNTIIAGESDVNYQPA